MEKLVINHLETSNSEKTSSPIDWIKSDNLSNYNACVEFMENKSIDIHNGKANECVWLVEHTPFYTFGTSANDAELLSHELPVYKSGRGGKFTYHGYGQRVVYVMLDLKKRNLGIKEYVCCLEQWIIDTLKDIGISSYRKPGLVGIWVRINDKSEAKIAAIGVRIKKWVSYHGISINLNPDMKAFKGIVPCGIDSSNYGVTSIHQLGHKISMDELDTALKQNFLF